MLIWVTDIYQNVATFIISFILKGTLVLAHQDKNTIPRRTPLFEFNNEASSGSKLFAPVSIE